MSRFQYKKNCSVWTCVSEDINKMPIPCTVFHGAVPFNLNTGNTLKPIGLLISLNLCYQKSQSVVYNGWYHGINTFTILKQNMDKNYKFY